MSELPTVESTVEPAHDFRAPSSRGRTLSLADFEGKVPLALAFLGPLEPESRELADLDHHQVEFGRRRVQLLAIAQAEGPEVRAVPWAGLDLPVLADPHGEIAAKFADGGPEQGFFVLLDPSGMIIERGPLQGAASLLERVDANADRLGMTIG